MSKPRKKRRNKARGGHGKTVHHGNHFSLTDAKRDRARRAASRRRASNAQKSTGEAGTAYRTVATLGLVKIKLKRVKNAEQNRVQYVDTSDGRIEFIPRFRQVKGGGVTLVFRCDEKPEILERVLDKSLVCQAVVRERDNQNGSVNTFIDMHIKPPHEKPDTEMTIWPTKDLCKSGYETISVAQGEGQIGFRRLQK